VEELFKATMTHKVLFSRSIVETFESRFLLQYLMDIWGALKDMMEKEKVSGSAKHRETRKEKAHLVSDQVIKMVQKPRDYSSGKKEFKEFGLHLSRISLWAVSLTLKK
jgi:hypothetical protein